MKKSIAVITISMILLAGMAGAESRAVKEAPLEVVNQFSPLITWKVILETDSGGNTTFEGYFPGKLYSIDTINATLNGSALDQSTNVTFKITEPYEMFSQTIDAYSGNNTTYPRTAGGFMYNMIGGCEVSITSGMDNATVPVYITLER